ncbi:SIMPL domain-containing protein [Methylobacterium sp.]|uniref:SIMPL domain-containing protein n=1 Tax=Methylobacterium sp. TaxID=409 RepID=UPI00258AC896|nr:SIMPL domain-containing protein [Methylobacterium sp.]
MRRPAAPSLALLAWALAAPVLAAPAAAEEGRITVVGRASVEAVPDYATVEIAVESRGPTAAAALDQNSAAAQKVIAFAKEFDAEVSTTAVVLQPVTRPVRDARGQEAPDGYRALNAVHIRLKALARLGELMRRSLDGGADRIGGVSFGLLDPARTEDEARAAAVRDAIRQARGLAEAAGVRLGAVERIVSPARTEGAVYASRTLAAKARAPSVPLEAGTVTVEAAVEATWRIAGAP